MDFLKEIAVGFKSAKSYPAGHPVMEKVIDTTMVHVSKLYTEIPEFSMYFLEKTVIFQDLRIDVSKNTAILSLLDALRKNDISSLTFESNVSSQDVRNLYEVLTSPKLKIKQFGDAATFLQSKGTQTIKINAVTFGIQTGATSQVATEPRPSRSHGDIVDAIRSLKELVEKGAPTLEAKSKLKEVLEDITQAPADSRYPYSEAIARIIEHLPAEYRLLLLDDVELKSFVLKLFSNLGDDTLSKLLVAKIERGQETDVKSIIEAIGDDKFARMMPGLKKEVPNVLEYLAQVGIMLSEQISSSVSKDDLRASIRPYYTMLDSKNVKLREEGARALITLASRFIIQKNYELADEIVLRIAMALEQEMFDDIILKLVDHVHGLYHNCRAHNRDRSSAVIIEAFSKISGRGDIPIALKKKIIQFLSGTNNPTVLPILFSFLWESGIYPDVRTAIAKFGKDAVRESLSTLKVAEDHALMTRLVDILKNVGDEGVDILVDSLDAPEWTMRRNIVVILGDVGDRRVVPRLAEMLKDRDDRVRLELVKTFAKLDYSDGLMRALKDKAIEVRAEALKGLRTRIAPENIKELLPLFKEKGDAVHVELLKVVGEHTVHEAADWMVDFLRSLELRNDAAAQDLKEMAVTTIGKLQGEKARKILEAFTSSKDKTLANLAVAALKRIS
jgi:hypothetical protein